MTQSADKNTVSTISISGIDYDDSFISPTYSLDSTYVLDTTTNSDTTFTINVPTEDSITFPTSNSNWPGSWEIDDMVEMYPALKIQYDKFMEVYNLIKDDYKLQKGGLDDDIPF